MIGIILGLLTLGGYVFYDLLVNFSEIIGIVGFLPADYAVSALLGIVGIVFLFLVSLAVKCFIANKNPNAQTLFGMGGFFLLMGIIHFLLPDPGPRMATLVNTEIKDIVFNDIENSSVLKCEVLTDTHCARIKSDNAAAVGSALAKHIQIKEGGYHKVHSAEDFVEVSWIQ